MTAKSGAPLRLVYMGTAAFAEPALRALAESRHEIVAVYTQPARAAGRGMKTRPSPIERAAAALGLPVRSPASLKDEAEQAGFAALDLDLAVVAAYGLILPQPILDAPRLGCINLHGSRLPRWRGAAPIERAILAGDEETGVTVIQMEAGLDTGPMLAMERVAIGERTTAEELGRELAALAARMAVDIVDRLAEGPVAGTPQPGEGATYARKIEKEEGRIDWRQPAKVIDRKLRALNPRPGCWTTLDDERLKILRGEAVDRADVDGDAPPGAVLDEDLLVACGGGALRLLNVQKAGGKPMSAAAFLRGRPLGKGARLGSPWPATN